MYVYYVDEDFNIIHKTKLYYITLLTILSLLKVLFTTMWY